VGSTAPEYMPEVREQEGGAEFLIKGVLYQLLV